MLFASFKYHISPSFPITRIEELKHVLDHNGAHEVAGEGWLKEVNLVVSNSMKFEGWEEVKERNESKGEEEEVYVVTDKWVDRSLVLGKTQSPHHYSADPSLIFSGIIACATSLPPSDLEVLSAGITALGGQWRTGLTKDVTHLFAMSPDSQKYATAIHFREETGVKVVLPHWFDDAVRLGMGGLSTDVYEWPDPEMLKNPLGVGGGGGQEVSGVKKNMYAMAALFTAPMHDSSLKYLEVTGGVDIWKGKKIVLSRTLQLFDRRREAVQIGIERAGGVVVRYDGDEEVDEGFGGGQEEMGKREKERRRCEADKLLESDVLVTRWRDGAAYVAALGSRKTIGTLAWLFHVQSTGTLTRPLDQLLHYPVPKRPIEAFSNHVITVTNYTGEAREYLKKLIIAMGAKFTPSMSGQNTVLIAAYISGTKATKAQSWSIPIVNHTWLEDCFIQWRNLTVGLEKYIGFPSGVDFSRLLGVRGLGAIVEEGLEEAVDEVHGVEGGAEKAPRGTDASVREVQGLIVSEDVDMADMRVRDDEEDPVGAMMDIDQDEDERTPAKETFTKASTVKQKVNGRDTSPIPASTPRISPRKAVEEPEEEEDEEAFAMTKTNGNQKRKTKNWLSSPEDDEQEAKPTRIQKQTQKQKTTKKKKNELTSSSEDEIENEDEGEVLQVDAVSSKVAKTNFKKQKQQGKIQLRSKKSKDEDDSQVEAVSSKIAKAELNTNANAKGRGKGKVTARQKRSKDEDEDEEDIEVIVEEEVVSSEVDSKKIHLKEKYKGQPRSNKSKSKSRGQDEDDDDMDDDAEEDENPKSKGVVKTGKKRKFIDDDNEDVDEEEVEDEEAHVISKPKAKTKTKVTTPIKYPSPTKPTISSKPAANGKNRPGTKPKAPEPAPVESEDDSENQLALSPIPPRARNTKLIRRVSGVVPNVHPDKQMSSSEDEEEEKEKRKEEREEKAKPRLSLMEKNQAKRGDARTRVRKRKVEVVEVEEDEEEEEEEEEAMVLVKSSSSKGKTKAKSGSASVKAKDTQGKAKSRVQHTASGSEEEEDDKLRPQKRKTNKKTLKPTKSAKVKSSSEEEPSDSDSDLPAAPFLSYINGTNKEKRVSGGSTAIPTPNKPAVSTSAPAAKSKSATKSKSKSSAKVTAESEDEDEDIGGVLSTPKRAISVLMPSFNLSGNKKSAKDVEKKNGKKAKLSVSSEEEGTEEESRLPVNPRSRAITRTESIRVMSNHQVQVSAKYSEAGAAASGSAAAVAKKKKTNTLASPSKAAKSKSKSKPETTPMDIDSPSPSPSPPPPPRPATKKLSSPKKPPSPLLRRSAATKATQRLHDTIMPDLLHFESQMKRANAKGRKSGGLTAFKVEGDDVGGSVSVSVGKRSQTGDEDEDGEGEGEEVEARVKKRRKVDVNNVGGIVSVSISSKSKGKRKAKEEEEEVGAMKRSSTKGKGKAAVSDDDRNAEAEDDDDGVVVVSSSKAVGAKTKKEVERASKSGVVLLTTQVTLSDEVTRALTKLGVKITSRPSECTHLLAPQLVRTEKFLCALVVAPFILTEKWAVQSAAVKKLLPEKGFALRDLPGENKYGVDLTQSLRRAKELRGKLLTGQMFYVTPRVPVDTKLLKSVVNACGGQVTTQQPTARIINASPQNRHVISCKEDIAIWRPIAAQGVPIYSQELLLTGALKQEIEWDADGVRIDID